MPEPINVGMDFKTTRGIGVEVSVRFFLGSSTGTDAWGTAVEDVFAVNYSGYDLYEPVDRGGEVRRGIGRYALRLSDLPSRPPIRSLILDGSRIWQIDGPEDTSPFGAILECDVTEWVGDEPP